MASPLIIIVGADKGGAGKTTITRALLDYANKNNVAVRSFDTEPGEGVLRRFFPRTEALNVDTVPGQMKLVDAADTEAVTVVDARAGALTPIMKAFGRINLLKDVRDGVLRMIIIHVIGPTVASEHETADVDLGFVGAKVVHLLNHTHPDAKFVAPSTAETTIEIPNLDQTTAQAVDIANLPFATFSRELKHSRTLRGYVDAWLTDVFVQFDKAGIGAAMRGT